MTPSDTDQANTQPANAAARTELEARLTSPQGPDVRAQYLTRLHALAARIDRQITRGLSRIDYQTSRALAQAVATATEILEQHPAAQATASSLPSPADPSAPRPLSNDRRQP